MNFAQAVAHVLKLHQSGQLEDAKRLITTLAQQLPNHPEVFHLLAYNYYLRGEITNAIKNVDYALTLAPQHPVYANTKGIILRKCGDLVEAEKNFKLSLSKKADLVNAYINLSNLLIDTGRFSEAQTYIDKGLKYFPNNTELKTCAGKLCIQSKYYQGAIEAYQSVLSVRPNSPSAMFNLALALNKAGRAEEALEWVSKVIKIKPEYAKAYLLRGEINEHCGRIDFAKQDYLNARSAQPTFAEAYWSLANLKSYQFTQSDIKSMENLLEKSDKKNVIYLSFSLYFAHEQHKNFAIAFDYLKKGNALKRQSFKYSPAQTTRFIERQYTVFNSDIIQKLQVGGRSDIKPIFIIGMPRSGTSLIEQILAGHSQVVGGGELESAHHHYANCMHQLHDAIKHKDMEKAAINIAAFAEAYISENKALCFESEYFTDKMPYNFSIIGVLASAFPNAKFVHIYKQPVDACFGCFRQLFSGKQQFSYDLTELADFYKAYRSSMENWNAMLGEKVINVSYEKLVRSPQSIVRDLFEQLTLQWEQDCLNLANTKRTVKTASAGQVRGKIYQSAQNRWHNYKDELNPLKIALAEFI